VKGGVRSAWLAAALALSVAVGGTADAQDAVVLVRVHVVGAGDAAPDLEARLRDLLSDGVPALELTSEPAFAAERLFRVDDADSALPTAWLVLDGPRARVRAAGAGRTRFVFRDLDVGQPLTEFDRERLGQTVKAALATLVAGGPGALTLADAAAASGVVLPKREVQPPAAPPAPVPTVAAPAPAAPEPTVGLAAAFQVDGRGGQVSPNVALLGTLRGSQRRFAPELALMLGHRTAKFYGNYDAGLVVQSLWARATFSIEFAELLRLGLGIGVDRETTTWSRGQAPADSQRWYPVVRFLARLGPTRVAGLQATGTVFVEVTRPIEYPVFGDPGFYMYQSGPTQPGASVELWWR
jgi:hypothetical protein